MGTLHVYTVYVYIYVYNHNKFSSLFHPSNSIFQGDGTAYAEPRCEESDLGPFAPSHRTRRPRAAPVRGCVRQGFGGWDPMKAGRSYPDIRGYPKMVGL